MHGNFPYMIDYWADTAVHLFLLKGSKAHTIYYF